MIKGVTPPFEYGRTVEPDARRAATALYIAGMQRLFDRFGPQTGGSGLLDLEAQQKEGVDSISFVVERCSASIVGISDQIHSWGIGTGGFVERDDSPILGKEGPERERTVAYDAPVQDQLAALKRTVHEREALGMSSQPVDEQEVTSLFALLEQATWSGYYE